MRVLIADDDATSRKQLGHFISKMGHRILIANDGQECIDIIEREAVDILLLDIKMPKKDGFDVLEHLKGLKIQIPVIMVTASDEIEMAVRCMQLGAYTYITKGKLDSEVLRIAVSGAIKAFNLQQENQRLEKELISKDLFQHIRGKSYTLEQAKELVMQVMKTDLNVLLLGESGTGKELFAQAIHEGSQRKSGAFVPVNCAAISNELADSLLFGHKKGAFTGANSDHAGFFEQADGGTIFLDEIGDMNSEIQAKVLRVLQEKKVRRVGEKTERAVDFRVVSATNRDFSKAIRDNIFREDLYYRLEGFPISIPPLRERSGDLPVVAKYFLEQFCTANNLQAMQFSQNALAGLECYHWPGNVRELKNAVQRAAVTSRSTTIENIAPSLQGTRQPDLAMERLEEPPQPSPASAQPAGAQEAVTMDELEQSAVRRAFSQAQGNASKAADSLGISRATFYRKLKKYGISE